MSKNFPQGIALASEFCNRDTERKDLKKSIELHEHVVIIAPRRYGKTSLISKVLQEVKYPSASIDFFFVEKQSEVEKQIEILVSKIASKIVQKNKKAAQKFVDNLKKFNPKLTLNLLGQKLEITSHHTAEINISELLLSLDNLAEQAEQTCIVVMDEFQQIAELKESHAIEAAIRHAVERSRYVSYIFCGSKRHMLDEMFSDRSRPLYHLCDLMTVKRISTKSYIPFIDKKAVKRWNSPLPQDALQEIFTLTENHPYYINTLCRRLWHYDTLPDISIVQREWQQYVTKQAPWIINDIEKLSLSRKKVLFALAHTPTKALHGKAFSDQAALTPSGVQKSFEYLKNHDLVYEGPDHLYHVMDPAISYFIRQSK